LIRLEPPEPGPNGEKTQGSASLAILPQFIPANDLSRLSRQDGEPAWGECSIFSIFIATELIGF